MILPPDRRAATILLAYRIRPPARSSNPWAQAWVATLALCLSLVGCRTNEQDLARWAETQHGPTKLVAVLSHDKFPDPLRARAALTLIEMKPRGGRRIGIDEFLETYPDLPAATRARLNRRVVPQLVVTLRTHPEQDASVPDPSIADKDAAFSLLTATSPRLVDDEQLRLQLRAALTEWAMADFVRRLDAPGQRIDMTQLLKALGPESTYGLPALLVPDAQKTNQIAQIIAEVGDSRVKQAAAAKLINLAEHVRSAGWLDAKSNELKEANAAAKLEPTETQLKQQLQKYQAEELQTLFASLGRVGERPSFDYLTAFGGNPEYPTELRVAALAALRDKLPRDDSSFLERLVALVGTQKTPVEVRGVGLRLLAEMPREKIADRLYGLFTSSDWQIRQSAAELLLLRSEARHLDEFMTRLRRVRDMSAGEALRYGRLIGDLKGTPEVSTMVDSYTRGAQPAPVRAAAVSYYYAHGSRDDLEKLDRLARDRGPVPYCREGAEGCSWQCGDREAKTIGDFVQFCVKPFILKRSDAPQRPDSSIPDKKAAEVSVKASPDGAKDK